MSFDKNLPHYSGTIHPNCDYSHGQIFPAKGVKCYQISRANRSFPSLDDNTGYTYKHAPDIAYFNSRFYVQYLCNPKDEHSGAGLSVLASSANGCEWTDFIVSFPVYKIKKQSITDYKGLNHSFDGTTYAFMHQRMCFFKADNNRMLLLGFYGWSPEKWMTNWDNYGIGRVVRELYADGSVGSIYFIRVNLQAGWKIENLNYPLYTECNDKGFVCACNELLNNRLYVQQWAEENGDIDEIIQIKHPKNGKKNEAFCWYHIDEKIIVGLWKHSRVSRSDDNGNTWLPVTKSPSLVMSGQKVWGCKTSDGKFAMVYDPTLETQHRYPLCVTTSEDGYDFNNMLLIHGEVPSLRYKGFWKDMGPQYMRGIAEGLDFPDKNLWITYSVNKEDIWAAMIPVPINGVEEFDIAESFNNTNAIDNWNIYCPKWAIAQVISSENNSYLHIANQEPYDYCKVERIIKKSCRKEIAFSLIPNQDNSGCLFIELWNDVGQIAVRLVFRENGYIYARTVTELQVMKYHKNVRYDIKLFIDCKSFSYQISINDDIICDYDGSPKEWPFMMAVNDISRFILRTGALRLGSLIDTDPENMSEEQLSDCEQPLPMVSYDLYTFEAHDTYNSQLQP